MKAFEGLRKISEFRIGGAGGVEPYSSIPTTIAFDATQQKVLKQ